jgi:hypothetical protein
VSAVVAYAPEHAVDCARVLASVPEWFGRPAANAQYLADLATYASLRAHARVLPAAGFEPLFESTRIWDERTPALVLVKSLAAAAAAARA